MPQKTAQQGQQYAATAAPGTGATAISKDFAGCSVGQIAREAAAGVPMAGTLAPVGTAPNGGWTGAAGPPGSAHGLADTNLCQPLP